MVARPALRANAGRSKGKTFDYYSECPVCGTNETHPFFALSNVPVNCSALWATKEAALGCQLGHIELTMCSGCELIFNRRYDPQLMTYSDNYDNSLDFSSAFQIYAQELSARLRETYRLRSKHVVEIGSGRGRFLKLLCEDGTNYGVGYDPSFGGEVGGETPCVRFVQDFYANRYASEPVDFLCCRHVLEHIEKPLDFLINLRQMLAPHGDVVLYFEVPNACSILTGSGLWDIIYQHVLYFTKRSLSAVFARAGFEVVNAGTAFAGQFLFLEARLASSNSAVTRSDSGAARGHSNLKVLTDAFGARFRDSVLAWSNYIQAALQDKKRLAFWGAGAKGVTFLNVVPHAAQMRPVIDCNPRKAGMYVPGTGQRILSPAHLQGYEPDIVATLNPVYRQEIASMLSELKIEVGIATMPESPAS